jgi:5-methylcytosine-specific restriction endonuclease McrA
MISDAARETRANSVQTLLASNPQWARAPERPMQEIVESARRLNDEQLLVEARSAVARERGATNHVVVLLAEIDARKLYVSQGYSCLRSFCTLELQYSNSEAANRVRAARAIQTFPVALDMLSDNALTLTNLYLLAPHLTTSNHAELLQAARFKTKREVQDQIAALYPGREQRIPWHVHVSRETDDKLHRAQDLLRHVIPDGNVADVLDRALTVLIDHAEQQKLGGLSKPRRPQKASLSPRYIRAAVKRAVWKRDGARCTFVGPKGRCIETGKLEFHHIVAAAFGGPSTVENVQLRCRTHNQHEMEKDFPLDPEAAHGGSQVPRRTRQDRRRGRGS